MVKRLRKLFERRQIDKMLLKQLKQRRDEVYADPRSIQKKYDEFLEAHGVYHSLNQELFFNSVKNRSDLCEGTLSTYFEATYDNEKLFLLDCLLHMGYNRNSLVELVLNEFNKRHDNYLWEYADFLYNLKNYKYMNEYLKIIMDKSYGDNRQMLILLVGKSKSNTVLPYLLELAADDEDGIIGHVLIALSNFNDDRIIPAMKKYVDYPKKWIADVAEKYLSQHYCSTL